MPQKSFVRFDVGTIFRRWIGRGVGFGVRYDVDVGVARSQISSPPAFTTVILTIPVGSGSYIDGTLHVSSSPSSLWQNGINNTFYSSAVELVTNAFNALSNSPS